MVDPVAFAMLLATTFLYAGAIAIAYAGGV